jgi:RNA polymerase sigma factor (sigma-70 family)
VQNPTKELLRTRTTLINRLKNWADQESWEEFFEIYEGLIHAVAVKSGLTATEAQDVVQETMVSVAKHMAGFKYDRKIGTFKTWLLTMARWRIVDQLRQRHPLSGSRAYCKVKGDVPPPLDNIPDRRSLDMDALWNAEWKSSLLEVAMTRVKRSLSPQHYQVFDLYVNREWAPDKIAKTYGISVGQVYLTKNRVSQAIKKEVERLKTHLT